MTFACPSCGKSFTRKTTLNYHIVNKVCQKPNDKMCPHCHKEFASKRMCQYHISHKVCEEPQKVHRLPKITLKSNYYKMSREDLIARLYNMEGKYESLKENPQTVNHNKFIIVPPAFLEADNYHQLMNIPNLLHEALSRHPANFVSYLIKKTNCNPNMPIYNSIKCTSKKDPFLQISDGKKFVYAPRDDTISRLIENKKGILQQYVDDNGDRYGKIILNKYQKYLEFLDNESNSKKNLELEIICMLLNMSDVIGSDDWSKKLLEDLKISESDQIANI